MFIQLMALPVLPDTLTELDISTKIQWSMLIPPIGAPPPKA